MKMDLLPYNNENLLANFPPMLRKNFKELFARGKIGLSPITLNDIVSTKQYRDNNSTYSYYYTIRIPYAGERLSWELIFDPEDMSFAPDFNFNDDNFHMSSDIDYVTEYIPSLVNWNVNNPKSLTSVLKEFICLYKKQQLQKLEDNIYAHLNSEYQVLTEEVSPDDIEIYIDGNVAHFLINIKVDLSSLPEYLQPTKDNREELPNPGDDTCVLKISFMKLDGARMNTSLQFSPRLDQVLGNSKTLYIPSYVKANSLADYTTLVMKLLQEHVRKVEQYHKLKKEYMTCLYAICADKMMEFDSETFSLADLLCEVGDYSCRVRISIGEIFPTEKPTVTLHCIYCVPSEKSCSEKVNDYPYSQAWTPELMIKKLVASFAESVPKFMNHNH